MTTNDLVALLRDLRFATPYSLPPDLERRYEAAREALRSGEYVLVPKEPSEDMLRAGSAHVCFHGDDQARIDAGHVYRAMLTASQGTKEKP